jgi:hypothetical protein
MIYLKDIATIRSGYLFREKIVPHPAGQYQVIQVGDISPDAQLPAESSKDSFVRVNLPDVKRAQVLEPGEVLFISRGQRKQAVAFTLPLENTIATSQFFVIRPNEKLIPEFLAWYINQPPAQRYIEEHSTGTSVSLINLEAMKTLPIETPPLETQTRIVKIQQLSLREKALMETIRDKRRRLIETALLEAVRGGEA